MDMYLLVVRLKLEYCIKKYSTVFLLYSTVKVQPFWYSYIKYSIYYCNRLHQYKFKSKQIGMNIQF